MDDLLRIYGTNYFADTPTKQYPNAYREGFLIKIGKALGIAESEIEDHVLSLSSTEHTKKSSGSCAKALLEDYLSTHVVHKDIWSRLTRFFVQKDKTAFEQGTLTAVKEELVNLRVQGGVDYYTILRDVYDTVPMKQLQMKLTAAQLKNTRMLFECDRELAGLYHAFKKEKLSLGGARAAAEVDVLASSLSTLTLPKKDAMPDTFCRTGRYFKSWSRLSAKEKDERICEYILYEATRNEDDKYDSFGALYDAIEARANAAGVQWSKLWCVKDGVLWDHASDVNAQKETETAAKKANMMQAASAKRVLRSQQNSDVRAVLTDLLYVLVCVGASRRPRTRQQVLNECVSQYVVPVPIVVQDQLLKIIDKIYLHD